MSSGRALGLSGRTEAVLVRVLQVALAGVLAFGLLEGDTTVVVNAAGALVVTELPAVLRRNYRVTMDGGLVLWLSVTALLHAVGTLGPYETVWWWDDLAHVLSAAVVAAAGYATARTLDVRDECLRLPSRFLFLYLLLFVMAVGVAWELLEFSLNAVAVAVGLPQPLTQYGLDDTVTDLVFDAAGALAVAVGASWYLGRGHAPSSTTDGSRR